MWLEPGAAPRGPGAGGPGLDARLQHILDESWAEFEAECRQELPLRLPRPAAPPPPGRPAAAVHQRGQQAAHAHQQHA